FNQLSHYQLWFKPWHWHSVCKYNNQERLLRLGVMTKVIVQPFRQRLEQSRTKLLTDSLEDLIYILRFGMFKHVKLGGKGNDCQSIWYKRRLRICQVGRLYPQPLPSGQTTRTVALAHGHRAIDDQLDVVVGKQFEILVSVQGKLIGAEVLRPARNF